MGIAGITAYLQSQINLCSTSETSLTSSDSELETEELRDTSGSILILFKPSNMTSNLTAHLPMLLRLSSSGRHQRPSYLVAFHLKDLPPTLLKHFNDKGPKEKHDIIPPCLYLHPNLASPLFSELYHFAALLTPPSLLLHISQLESQFHSTKTKTIPCPPAVSSASSTTRKSPQQQQRQQRPAKKRKMTHSPPSLSKK
jgi:hypothetical protein